MQTGAGRPGGAGGFVALRRLALCMGAGLALGLVLSAAWLYVLRNADTGPEVFEIVIPPGAAASVARGESPPSIPSRFELRAGDRLVVRNRDEVEHQIGQLFVRAGTSAELPLSNVPDRNQFLCTFHVAGQIDLDVARTPAESASLLLASLLVGGPLGLSSFAVVSLAGKL